MLSSSDGLDSTGASVDRRSVKRKLADTLPEPSSPEVTEHTLAGDADPESTAAQVRRLLNAIKANSIANRKPEKHEINNLRRAAHALAEIAKQEENVDTVVNEGAVGPVVALLTLFTPPLEPKTVASISQPLPKLHGGEEVEKEACFIVGLMAIRPEHQHEIADRGALRGLVSLLKRHVPGRCPPGPGASVARRAADAITNLAHENVPIKSCVRGEGGIDPLVHLLESFDAKVQRAAAGALRTLAFKNEENKNLIVDCQALPTLIQMLRSDDVGIHYEAVGVIGNLVHSSQHIKKTVLDEGALQPVIGLLSSRCTESQREAALLLGQFATATVTGNEDYKARIVQRGAVPPLITMLGQTDVQLKEMGAFALGRLAQNADNQAGIVQSGGLPPLLDLLDSRNGNLQHNAAFALYGLADNEDNIGDMVREGAVQRLQACDLIAQPSRDCVQKTLKRLEDKIVSKVLSQIMYAMYSSDRAVFQRCACALAHMASIPDLHAAFVERKGLDILVDMLTDGKRDTRDALQREAASALNQLAEKIQARKPIPPEQLPASSKVVIGEEFVNNPTLSDVTFLVEGQKFHAHRIALLASSDTFRAMFDGHYREKDASEIPIPNIRYEVFRKMMTCAYTGSVDVPPDLMEELLQAADQYMLGSLKRLCEIAIADTLTVENLSDVYDTAENYDAPQLAKRCVLFALEHFATSSPPPANFDNLLRRMGPKVKGAFMESLVDMDVNALKDAWARRQALAGDGNGAAAAQPAAAQQQQQQQQPQQQAPGQDRRDAAANAAAAAAVAAHAVGDVAAAIAAENGPAAGDRAAAPADAALGQFADAAAAPQYARRGGRANHGGDRPGNQRRQQ